MGCEGSKERPRDYRQAPTRYDGQHDGRNGSYNQPAYQPQPYQGGGSPGGYPQQPVNNYRTSQEAREQREVETARALVSARGNSSFSYPQPPPPPPAQSPSYVPPPTQAEIYERHKTESLLNQQRLASVEQLAEVYPKLDRNVIRGVLQDCNGDQTACHQMLGELSGNDVNAEDRFVQSQRSARGMNPSPPSIRWQPGAAVDANFQGQWFSAVIESEEPNGDYNVKWTSDGTNTLVTPAQIRERSQ